VSFRAVLFDLGGVVLGSPLQAIAAYERDAGIPAQFVNRTVVDTGPAGAWSRLERGELDMEAFFAAFEAECSGRGQRVDARAMMLRIGAATAPRPQMLAAIGEIRRRGLVTAALTNNWSGDGTQELRRHFDAFIESCVVGLRKPDPRIYRLACEQAGVQPAETVFLDDIGRNLKSARELGMRTIKVEDPDAALGELEQALGFALRSGTPAPA
jgi:epoxide hydrolase-like predicted phosphatase